MSNENRQQYKIGGSNTALQLKEELNVFIIILSDSLNEKNDLTDLERLAFKKILMGLFDYLDDLKLSMLVIDELKARLKVND